MGDLKTWALASGYRIVTEDGDLVGVMASEALARGLIEDHNIEVDLNEPEPPEVEQARQEQERQRLKAWRENEATEAELLTRIISGGERCARLLSLKAPSIIISEQLRSMAERLSALQLRYPEDSAHD